jgi:hypothetical protein
MNDLWLIPLIAVLWRLGGWKKAKWSGYRDVLVPVILSTWITFHHGLILGVLCGLTLNIIRMGYGTYDPINDPKPSFLGDLTHDRGGWWIRGIVGVLYVLVGLCPLAIHTRQWGRFTAWCVVSGATGWVLCRLKAGAVITELVIGAICALSVIFF